MTGIVTKCAVKVVPKPPERMLYGAISFGMNAAEELMKQLPKTDIIMGDFSFSWQTILMMSGLKHPLREIRADEPTMMTGLISALAMIKRIMKNKERMLVRPFH